LLNAIQAIGKNGTIEIDISKKSDFATVVIKNTGPIISKKDKENIFTPFFTTKSNGTGLGLAITKKIIDLHNATIEVQSSEKDGTFFKFVFPAEEISYE